MGPPFHRFSTTGDPRARVRTIQFAIGYLAAWFAYGLAAAGVQRLLLGVALALAPLVFAGAGIYQFAPLKRACLTHCRSPFSYFLARWRNGPTASFRMGVAHGVYCVGCCWALMATTAAVGMANLWWMAALAAIAFVEQVAPHGDKLRVPIGVALLVAASWV